MKKKRITNAGEEREDKKERDKGSEFVSLCACVSVCMGMKEINRESEKGRDRV